MDKNEFLLISPWKTGAIRRYQPLFLAPNFPEILSRAASNDSLSTENCFLLQQQDSLALASTHSSRNLKQIDCNNGDQALYAPQHIELLPPRRH